MSCFSANAAKGKKVHHEVPDKPWEVVETDMFTHRIKTTFVL